MSINDITGDSIRTGNRKEDQIKLKKNWDLAFKNNESLESNDKEEYKVIWATNTAVFKKHNRLLETKQFVNLAALKEALSLVNDTDLDEGQMQSFKSLKELAGI